MTRTFSILLSILLLLTASTTFAQTPNRPHDVAVSGGDIVATSVGTNSVSVLSAGQTPVVTLDVTSPSWGVCFAGGLAYVTLPQATHIAVIDVNAAGGPAEVSTIAVPRGCTEIISNAAGTLLFVANTGMSLAAAEVNQWQHSIWRIDLSTQPPTASAFDTERQPRALVLSKDESLLFVGTVQGSWEDLASRAPMSTPRTDSPTPTTVGASSCTTLPTAASCAVSAWGVR